MINTETITNSIINDKSFIFLLSLYKNQYTKGIKVTLNNSYNNGLCSHYYMITINDELISILLPIFSTEKTITWNTLYLKDIKATLPEIYSDIDNETLESLILCPLYFIDKTNGSASFMQIMRVSTWINNGLLGKNGYSFYFWNEKLPNQYAVSSTHIKNYINKYLINNLSFKDLKQFCYDYAVNNHTKFHNTDRTEKQLIKNIMEGLYAQICVYKQLKHDGYDVIIQWNSDKETDDFGIDIKIKLKDKYYNIDVKSTHTKDLKIKSKRDATDIYAVTTWSDEEVIFKGLISKDDFWGTFNNNLPSEKNNMYYKNITSFKYINAVDIPEIVEHANIQKIKTQFKDNVLV